MHKYGNIIDKYYIQIVELISSLSQSTVPYLRRVLRFLALPYCFLFIVNWNECRLSKYKVMKDLLYIFFTLKYYPDNYTQCRLWEKDRKQWRYYYGSIYDPYQRGKLRKEVQKKEYEILFEDKEVCYQLCEAAKFPLPKQHLCIHPNEKYKEDIKKILYVNPFNKLIIKPARGKGGKDIVLVSREDDGIYVRQKNTKISLDEYVIYEKSVVQDYLNQHPSLASIAPSTNTVRIVTLLTKRNDVIILGAHMRFGIGDAYIDNVSSGGIKVGIDIDKGCLKKIGFNQKGNQYICHPTSGIKFEDFKLPLWSSVVQLSMQIQRYFSYYKLLGYDLAITLDGPVIIEINATPDLAGLESAYGPILREKKVWEAFKEYNLLINRKSKKAWINKDIILNK